MIFYIVCNTNLFLISFNPQRTIGELYQFILNKLRVTPLNVIYMIHNGSPLGLPPVGFDQSISLSNLYNHSVIYLVMNHYPILTENYCFTTINLYQQWLDRRNRALMINGDITFDPIFDPNTSWRSLSNNTTHASDPLIHNENRQQVHSTTLNQVDVIIEDEDDEEDDTTNTQETLSNGTTINTSYSSYTIPLQNLIQTVFNAYSAGYNTGYDDVRPTLNNQQFSQLERKHYRDIIDPQYNTCPITQLPFDNDCEVIILGCKHYFTVDAIKTWLLENSTKCPYCNKDVREQLN